MPYIGKSPVGGGFHKLDALTASATATYSLTLGGASYFPETANQLLVSLNGIIQCPQDSFTVSGSNLVFDSALTSSDSIDFVVALGDVLGVGSVSDGAITTAKLGNNAVTDAKLASTLDLSSKALTMPTGAVLQVKIATGATGNSGGVENSWIDVVSLDITPQSTSSKIFAQLSCTGYGSGTGYLSARGRIYNSTSTNVVSLAQNVFFRDGSGVLKASGSFLQGLDSPSSTATQTYKGQAFIETSSNHNLFWDTANGAPWTLSLMEIAG